MLRHLRTFSPFLSWFFYKRFQKILTRLSCLYLYTVVQAVIRITGSGQKISVTVSAIISTCNHQFSQNHNLVIYWRKYLFPIVQNWPILFKKLLGAFIRNYTLWIKLEQIQFSKVLCLFFAFKFKTRSFVLNWVQGKKITFRQGSRSSVSSSQVHSEYGSMLFVQVGFNQLTTR